jgi:hypothetical protein
MVKVPADSAHSRPRVFISYAKEDHVWAQRLHTSLKQHGASPWLDSQDLVPGQEWEREITKAIESSDFFIALLSTKSVNKRGYVQAEVRKALGILERMPEGRTFIIPARLQDCQPTHSKLQSLHWVDLFPTWDSGLQRIFVALELRPFAASQPADRKNSKTAEGPAKSRRRINLDLSQEDFKELDVLAQQSGGQTQTNLIRQSLALVKFMMQEAQNGNKLIVERDGKPVQIVLPSL